MELFTDFLASISRPSFDLRLRFPFYFHVSLIHLHDSGPIPSLPPPRCARCSWVPELRSFRLGCLAGFAFYIFTYPIRLH